MDYDYKQNDVYAGSSDIAQVTARGLLPISTEVGHASVCFNQDGSYRAHIVTDAPKGWKPPKYYEKCFECVYWLDIIDDESIPLRVSGFETATVYVVPHSRTMLIHAIKGGNDEIFIKQGE